METNQEVYKDRVLKRLVVFNWRVKEGLVMQKSKLKMVIEKRNLKFLEKQHYIHHQI